VFGRFVFFRQIPLHPNLGLLLIRVIAFLPLPLKHGAEKLFHFSTMAQHFPDPLHIGAAASLTFAMTADGICAPLIVIGFAIRWAALISFVNLFVAWSLVHHFSLFGNGGDHGELIVLYLGACVLLFFSGAGSFSIDGLIESAEEKRSERQEHASLARAIEMHPRQ
jgi:putative oxidoreductase